MSEGARGAIAGALAGAVEAARGDDAEQLDLIGIPADATVMSEERGARLRLIAGAARRGRPPGAQNLATREVKDFCRRVFGYDPMVEGFRWLQHTPETLAAALGCTRLEAFDRLERVRAELMPYFYARQAPVDADGKPVPAFSLTIGGQTSSAPGAQPPWIYAGGPVVEHEQNQEVSEAAGDQSHGDQSHGEAK